jgi:hypothetical protein
MPANGPETGILFFLVDWTHRFTDLVQLSVSRNAVISDYFPFFVIFSPESNKKYFFSPIYFKFIVSKVGKMLTEHEKATEKDLKLSIERIIDLVRNVRNGLIHDFLQDANLRTYFLQQYNRELSQVKAEFLKRDLKELLDSPVDLSHYGLLIKQMQDSNTASISSTHHDLFYKELEKIFTRYNY